MTPIQNAHQDTYARVIRELIAEEPITFNLDEKAKAADEAYLKAKASGNPYLIGKCWEEVCHLEELRKERDAAN